MIQLGPTAQRLASLKTCATSATMILGGDLYTAREMGFPEIARLQDYVPDLQFHSFFVDTRRAEANSQLVTRYLRAMLRAMQWVHAHKDEAAGMKGIKIQDPTRIPTRPQFRLRGRSFRHFDNCRNVEVCMICRLAGHAPATHPRNVKALVRTRAISVKSPQF